MDAQNEFSLLLTHTYSFFLLRCVLLLLRRTETEVGGKRALSLTLPFLSSSPYTGLHATTLKASVP